MQFAAKVLSLQDFQTQSLVVDALDEGAARRVLQSQGWQVLKLHQAKRQFSMKRERGAAFSLLLFCEELAALLDAGLSVIESVETLGDKEASASARGVISAIAQALREGRRFSQALEEQAHIFPQLLVGLIRAAEGTSSLPEALNRYISMQQRWQMLRAKIINASIYPLILGTVGLLVTLFLVAYVVPSFAAVYADSGRPLPTVSRLLLEFGQITSTHRLTTLGVIGLLFFSGFYFLRRLYLSGAMLRFLHRLPMLGAHVRLFELSRIYLNLGMLLEGGIPILAAVTMVADVGSLASTTALKKAKQRLAEGAPLSLALHEVGLSTPISQRLLQVGERSGRSGPMLTRAALFYEAELSRFVDRFVRVLEPVMMAVIGIIVGGVVLLLYTPIFDLAQNIR